MTEPTISSPISETSSPISESETARASTEGSASAALSGGCLQREAPVGPRSRSGRSRSDGRLVQSTQEQLQVLTALRASLQAHHETLDDPDLMLIMADGQTSLLELIDQILEADLLDEALLHGLKLQKDTLAVRLHRLEERRQSRRAILEQALLLLERKSLERPIATITLTDRPPSLVVEEEAQIPARYFDLKPVLNRRAAKEALQSGEDVPGVRLTNGALSLTVRRR